MLRVINLRGRRAAGERLDYAAIVPRAEFDVAAATESVRPICEDVARRGIAALADYSLRFDRVLPTNFRVPTTALENAAVRLHPARGGVGADERDRPRALAPARAVKDVLLLAGASLVAACGPAKKVNAPPPA